MSRIAVVGMACQYPDAPDTATLWDNVLAGRRAFRALPPERMSSDYYSEDAATPDRHYATKAAVIEGWEFDRTKYRVSGSTYRSTDLTHWLALDTVERALDDAGHTGGSGLDTTRTGVILGNTLTGEFSRASQMRLRWPYVRRTLAAALEEQDWDPERIAEFLASYEASYKSAFPPITEDTLAGGLANTIAGRICNYYDFGGGGYTVDGACSSSILAVTNAADALTNRHLDAAVVGGVDLSIDPFEVVGFAKTGALSTSEMRVYDRRSNGFWPGEGCGVLVLMREEEALASEHRIYATLTGWGYSSDGIGGITRPEASGHRLAIERAYDMAGYGFDSLGYVEGHGTGTKLGDETELGVFDAARRRAGGPPVPVGSIKGNIGHTKAAAGVAGLIKAALTIHHGVIPPVTGTTSAHPLFEAEGAGIRLAQEPEEWPEGPRRAAVSSMGFGGINGHITMEGPPAPSSVGRFRTARRVARGRQDAELLVVSAPDPARLADRLRTLAERAGAMSYGELADLSAALLSSDEGHRHRAAVVSADPVQAAARMRDLADRVDEGETSLVDPAGGRFLGAAVRAPRLGLMFPGQGAPGHGDGGAVARRFPVVEALYDAAGRSAAGAATETAQPRIVTASLAGLRLLEELGVDAVGCVGHSLGELTSLHWAGAFSQDQVLAAAAERGRIMASASAAGGAMASLRCAPEEVEPLIADTSVVISGFNGPRQTVVSGPTIAVDSLVQAAQGKGIDATPLNVSHAFHSPDVAPAADRLRCYLDDAAGTSAVERTGLYSTVSGDALPVGTEVPALLEEQVREPVRFGTALRGLGAECDLLLEVGPGQALSALARDICPDVPAVALTTDGDSLSGVLSAVGAAYAVGADVDLHPLVADRYARPVDLERELRFFESPCEKAPQVDHLPEVAGQPAGDDAVQTSTDAGAGESRDALETLRHLLAERVELPLSQVTPETRPLDELHLSSITVTQIAGEAARALGVSLPPLNTTMATATVSDIAEVLQAADGAEAPTEAGEAAAGVGPWVRAFAVRARTAPAVGEPRAAEPGEGQWRLVGRSDEVAERVLARLRELLPVGGVVVRSGSAGEGVEPADLLEAAREAIAGGTRFVTLDGVRGSAGLAKTLHLEHAEIPTTVVQLPPDPDPAWAEQIAADVAATTSFREVAYGTDGSRTVPVLTPLELGDTDRAVLGADDVVVVTGGAQGITIECALTLATETGCGLALLGRSAADSPTVAEALGRLESAGVRARYYVADVTDREAVRAAVDRAGEELGRVTGVLHGAGLNEPAPLETLDPDAFGRTWDTKVAGLAAVLDAVDRDGLRLLLAFGSIIGRAGLRGEAHYATANDDLRRAVEAAAVDLPDCRCLTIEWSVWAGAGMGERLGVLDSLVRDGIQPIPLDEGLGVLRALLGDPTTPTSVVVVGRTGSLPTISYDEQELPLWRFLERPLVHVPGVELVVEADLATTSDPYLLEHDLDGALLFPAVMGMEAMAHVAGALLDTGEPVRLEDVRFDQPIVVPDGETLTVRVAALRRDDTVDVVIRTRDTGFHTDHFAATARSGAPELTSPPSTVHDMQVPMDVADDFYGTIMFQGARFQVITGYQSISATSAVARIGLGDEQPWFGHQSPQDLLLASPAARDAFMHGIQVCVPNATLLPAAAERIQELPLPEGTRTLVLHAHERRREGSSYWYDLWVTDLEGTVYAEWTGLELHAVRDRGATGPWVPELLGPYLERRLGDEFRVAMQRGVGDGDTAPAERRQATATVVSAIVGEPVEVEYRGDGKPALNGYRISAAHSGPVTLAVLGEIELGCDLERVDGRPEEVWQDLLGEDGYGLAQHVAAVRHETADTSATRVWAAREALVKIGHAVTSAPLHSTDADADTEGWAGFTHGDVTVETFCASINEPDGVYVVAVAKEASS
ncbi:SDR family NAD(P)-dependent oxidoreductase [Phycicoccus sp. CSK15P-2]|uniref:type I polyketide synthase n=1 Tax=Phycicoccus sp. CSK15P-2 TaxID=2807627 RepID=UPI00194E919B|nr:type I polyketide synthase [Phycicoccus sp. CSK15P-2]MBM6405602.1 SDR family NAD(P)-dependent oxidoreductase [Phycicoccus sp. CSK15P-2]